jgi:hypothetical protein
MAQKKRHGPCSLGFILTPIHTQNLLSKYVADLRDNVKCRESILIPIQVIGKEDTRNTVGVFNVRAVLKL